MLEEKRMAELSRNLGVKFLDEQQLNSTFPDWKTLLERIEEQREIAKVAHELDHLAEKNHMPQMYDNLYAILGDRGTGKSSVLLTLREWLKRSDGENILLPIITPEVISEPECSILGWVLSATESVIDDLERLVKELDSKNRIPKSQNCCTKTFFRNCQFQKDNELRRLHKDLYKKSIETNGELNLYGYSAEDIILYRMEQSRKQYKLIQEINNFWEYLTRVWHTTHQLAQKGSLESCDNDTSPLIILMFDDIDLAPERSLELLSTTFQYFTNPNIAIVLTASENALTKMIRLKMYEKMVGSKYSSLMVDAYPGIRNEDEDSANIPAKFKPDPITELTGEFYDKVIPPSSRYHLRRFVGIVEKKQYTYSKIKQTFQPLGSEDGSSVYIKDFLVEQVDELREAFRRDGAEAPDNFLMQGNVFQEAYLLIFGEKNRNLANACLEIMNTFERLKRVGQSCKDKELGEEEHTQIRLALRHLIRALLLSRADLREYENRVELLLYKAPDRAGNYVDYRYPVESYRKERREVYDWLEQKMGESVAQVRNDRIFQQATENLGKSKKKVAALMTVLFFAEGVLRMMDNSQNKIHGHKHLYYLLTTDAIMDHEKGIYRIQSLPLFPQHKNTSEFLHDSPYALEHADRYINVDMYSLQFAQNYLEDVFQSKLQGGTKPADVLKGSLQKDVEWVKYVLKILTVRCSGMTLATPDFIHVSEDAQRKLSLFEFGDSVNAQLKLEAQKLLTQSDLPGESDRRITEFQKLLEEGRGDLVELSGYWWRIFGEDISIPLTEQGRRYDRAAHEMGLNKDNRYVKSYFIWRWTEHFKDGEKGDGGKTEEKNSKLGYCYDLVHFVKEVIEGCVRMISLNAEVSLSDKQMEETERYVRRADNYDSDFESKKNALLNDLYQARLYDYYYIRDDVKIYHIPAGTFIEYLAALQQNLKEEYAGAMSYAFYSRMDYTGMSDMMRFLTVYYPQNRQTVLLNDVEMPSPALTILDLRMLDFLSPYYFAAQIEIAQDTQYRSEVLWQNNVAEEPYQLKELNRRLKEFYDELAAEKRPGQKKLYPIMREARRELAEKYYHYLEDSYE